MRQNRASRAAGWGGGSASRRTWPLLMGAALVLAARATVVQAGQAEVDRFLAQYPEAGRRLEAAYGQVRGLLYVSQFGASDREPHESTRFAVDGSRWKYEFVDPSQPLARGGRPSHVGSSSKWSTFELNWSPKESAYVVENLVRGQDEPSRIQFLANAGRFLMVPYAVGGRPIPEMLARGTARVVGALEMAKDGRTLVRVDLELTEPRLDVTLDFDLGLGWAVSHGRSRMLDGSFPEITWDVSYDPAVAGVPVPKSASIDITRELSGRCRFDQVEFVSTPEREFTMTYYGMTDPYAPSDSWGGLRPWLAGGALLSAAGLAGLALRLRSRRRPVGSDAGTGSLVSG